MFSENIGPYPTREGSLDILRVRGSLRPKILKERKNYKHKLEFPDGERGSNPKNLLGGEHEYFLFSTSQC